MTTIAEVVTYLDQKMPPVLAESWDCVGLQVGRPDREVQTILTALDVTPAVIQEAVSQQTQLIVAHHPLIFSSLARFDLKSLNGMMVESLVQHQTALYIAHTNCDSAAGGLNDVCAQRLGLKNLKPILPSQVPGYESLGLGRIGTLPQAIPLQDFLDTMIQDFQPASLRTNADLQTKVKTVGVCTGSGASLWETAQAAKADVYVTGDVKYHGALDARLQGFPVVDLGHFASEIMVTEIFKDWIQEGFSSLVCHSTQMASDPLVHYFSRT
jgi:GTP cyclohydrolase I